MVSQAARHGSRRICVMPALTADLWTSTNSRSRRAPLYLSIMSTKGWQIRQFTTERWDAQCTNNKLEMAISWFGWVMWCWIPHTAHKHTQKTKDNTHTKDKRQHIQDDTHSSQLKKIRKQRRRKHRHFFCEKGQRRATKGNKGQLQNRGEKIFCMISYERYNTIVVKIEDKKDILRKSN